MSYKTLLFDIDDTLLDFKAAERQSISLLMKDLDVEPTNKNIQTYSRINKEYWGQFEHGLIEKNVLIAKRFETFFALHGLSVDGKVLDKKFRANLENCHYLMSGSIQLLESLQPNFELYAVTNGVASTQHRRIADSGLDNYFRSIFVSEETGYQKPAKEYFDYVFERIPGFDASRTMIIGDSLTSDILGGNNAGITSCWFNPQKENNPFPDIQPNFEITTLGDLEHILHDRNKEVS